jgi:hypothetical protein
MSVVLSEEDRAYWKAYKQSHPEEFAKYLAMLEELHAAMLHFAEALENPPRRNRQAV